MSNLLIGGTKKTVPSEHVPEFVINAKRLAKQLGFDLVMLLLSG
jgi:hypothetical protein